MPRAPLDRNGTAGPPLDGALLLAGALFTATLCAGIALVWLLDASTEPGIGLAVLAVVAIASMVVASYADATPSSRLTRTTELGNATRLLAILAVMLLVPSVLLAFTNDDQLGGTRTIDAACPEGDVPATDFNDVPETATHARAIDCGVWWGLFSPGGEEFGRTGVVTRADTALVLDRLAGGAGEPLGDADPGRFDDVTSPVHVEAIARVAEAGIMGGTEETVFSPDERITRSQLATAVVRTYEAITERSTPPAINDGVTFTDVSGVHAENAEAVAGAGIIVGTGDEFDPAEPVSKGQLATVGVRLLDLLVSEGVAELPSE